MVTIYLAYTVFCIMGYMSNIKGARYFIKKVGIIWKYYPKHYTLPAGWICKKLRINKKEILKYCCIQVYMAYIYLFLLFMDSLIFTLSGSDLKIGFILFYILIGIMVVDNIIFMFLLIFLGTKKKQR